jgi:hypothetical protein
VRNFVIFLAPQHTVASVESRVVNLTATFPKLTHDYFCAEMAKEFVRRFGAQDAVVEYANVDEVL